MKQLATIEARFNTLFENLRRIRYRVEMYQASSRHDKRFIQLDDAITKLLLDVDAVDLQDFPSLRPQRKALVQQIQETATLLENKVRESVIIDLPEPSTTIKKPEILPEEKKQGINQPISPEVIIHTPPIELSPQVQRKKKIVQPTSETSKPTIDTMTDFKKVRTDQRWYLKVNVLGSTIHALVDTGATHSYLSNGAYEQLKSLNVSSYGITPERVVMATGEVDIINRIISLPIHIGSRGGLLGVRLLPKLTTHLVLGMDYLKEADLIIHTKTGEWYYRDAPAVVYKFLSSAEVTSPFSTGGCSGIQPITESERNQLDNIVRQAKEAEPEGFEPTKLVEHKIQLTDPTPINQRPYPVNPNLQKVIHQEVQKMLDRGVIQPSYSDFSNPLILVKKKVAPGQPPEYRPCLDFRKLNGVTIKDRYPIPNMNAILNNLHKCRYISKIDLEKAFWLIALSPESRKYTSFQVPGMGSFEFKVMTFGLSNAPSEFQRLIDRVIGNDLVPNVHRYIDDLIIATETMEEQFRILREVFRRLREAGLKINWSKSEFGASQVQYLGYLIDHEGMKTDPEKIRPIIEYPAPRNVRELRRIIGMVTWYKRFLPNYSQALHPLTKLLKKSQKFKWEKEQEDALNTLKGILTTAPVLIRPNWDLGEFRIETDASNVALGAVLTQRVDGVDHVIEYASRTLTKPEMNYTTTERECLAVIFAIKKFRFYLENYKILCVTDHLSLKWLFSLKNPTARLARWAIELQGYDITFEHRKGTLHYIPDALSRIPSDETPEADIMNITTQEDLNAYDKWYQNKLHQIANHPEESPAYQVINGLLYHNRVQDVVDLDETIGWKLVPKSDQLARILTENHDLEQSGHMGVIKTFLRISKYYYWPGMFLDVARYVKACKQCQTCKPRTTKTPGGMEYKRQSPVGRQWYMDLMGPLPTSSKLNKYILVCQDDHTKFVEIIALRNATANTVVQHFKRLILYRYGVPKCIITDNGSSFVNQMLAGLSEEFNFTHLKTSAYTPQANIVERSNRVIKQMIRCYVNQRQTNWDAHLAELMFAINSSKQTSTGYSPNYLMYGWDVEPIHHLRRDLEGPGDINSTHDYTNATKRRSTLDEIHELVRINQLKAGENQAKYYNQRRDLQVEYNLGDLVLRRNFKQSSGADHYNAKLDNLWIGPNEIIKKLSPVVYVLKNLNTGIETNFHIKDIKKYIPPEDELDDFDQDS